MTVRAMAAWAAVRARWDAALARGNGNIIVPEQAEAGSASGERLLGLADDGAAGKLGTASAIVKAKAIIAEVTTTGAVD